MKGGLAAMVYAAKALLDSGIELKGDLRQPQAGNPAFSSLLQELECRVRNNFV